MSGFLKITDSLSIKLESIVGAYQEEGILGNGFPVCFVLSGAADTVWIDTESEVAGLELLELVYNSLEPGLYDMILPNLLVKRSEVDALFLTRLAERRGELHFRCMLKTHPSPIGVTIPDEDFGRNVLDKYLTLVTESLK